jgi:hypothetical protein
MGGERGPHGGVGIISAMTDEQEMSTGLEWTEQLSQVRPWVSLSRDNPFFLFPQWNFPFQVCPGHSCQFQL